MFSFWLIGRLYTHASKHAKDNLMSLHNDNEKWLDVVIYPMFIPKKRFPRRPIEISIAALYMISQCKENECAEIEDQQRGLHL